MRSRELGFVVLVLILAAVIGCGGGNKPVASNNPQPTPAPTPTPTPSPTPTPAPPPAPTPPPAQGPTQVMHAMMVYSSYPSKNGYTTVGSMSLNSDGSGTATFDTGFPQGTTWAFTFCPFPSPDYRGCPAITTISGDGSQKPISFPFHLTQKGTLAGVFVIENPNYAFYDSGFLFPATGDQFLSPLVRAGTVTGGIGNVMVGSEPLTGGQVTMNNSSAAHIAVQGAQPNTTYSVTYCFITDGSSCYQVGALATDASGNGTTDISDSAGSQTFEGVYYLSDANGVQYITGFTLK